MNERLIEARKTAGFDTAKAGSDRLGLNYRTYIQYESGERQISKNAAPVICSGFRVNHDWLMYNKGKMRGAPDSDVEMLEVVGEVQAGGQVIIDQSSTQFSHEIVKITHDRAKYFA